LALLKTPSKLGNYNALLKSRASPVEKNSLYGASSANTILLPVCQKIPSGGYFFCPYFIPSLYFRLRVFNLSLCICFLSRISREIFFCRLVIHCFAMVKYTGSPSNI
jgi:hypothetical protein